MTSVTTRAQVFFTVVGDAPPGPGENLTETSCGSVMGAPMRLTGFLPAYASVVMARHGVMSPLARLPRPTSPSSPASAEVPATVR